MSQESLEVTPLRTFITHSSYEGAWNSAVNMMDGFGSYRYPDGSEYRGPFVQGKFHGFGHLKLAQPYRFTIKGEFKHGKLVSIEDMWFNDGLHVQGTFSGSEFKCDQWDYLTANDRRYQAERRYGQQPVGPTSYLTNDLMARPIPDGCYDVEEGIFNPRSGYLLNRPAPFPSNTYVGCTEEREWIVHNCRRARTDHITEPLPSFCRGITQNNLWTEQQQLPEIAIYAPNERLPSKPYYHKLCKERANQKHGDDQKTKSKSADGGQIGLANAYNASALEAKTDQNLTEPYRQWTSSSDVRRLGSDYQTSCPLESFSDEQIRMNVKEAYDNVNLMKIKRTADDFHVVQSNLMRPASFVDLTRSVFEL
ncbi:radial spoke head 1 homolog [Drosophila tropicalis]|uniref:radial spoke head 1 homolog n=1 Tax=Drosophila tropicalis TaxID=46794 RepID=UPI0035ABE813